MKLRRQKRKAEKALDALASITKIWSEWQLAKRAGKGVAKAKRLRISKPVKLAGGAALLGGVGAVIARKLKGDPSPPTYSGPAPSEAVDAAAKAPDPPPLAIAPDPEPSANEIPAAGSDALQDGGPDPTDDEPAAGAAALADAGDDDTTVDEPAAEEPEKE